MRLHTQIQGTRIEYRTVIHNGIFVDRKKIPLCSLLLMYLLCKHNFDTALAPGRRDLMEADIYKIFL